MTLDPASDFSALDHAELLFLDNLDSLEFQNFFTCLLTFRVKTRDVTPACAAESSAGVFCSRSKHQTEYVSERSICRYQDLNTSISSDAALTSDNSRGKNMSLDTKDKASVPAHKYIAA